MMPTHPLAWFSAVILASFLFGLPQEALGASVEDATKAELKTATDAFEQGVLAMDAERFQEALDQFQRSYETVASPNSRMMVGRCLVKLGRFTEAYQVLSQTVADVNASAQAQKKYKKTLETAQKELDELKPKLSLLTLRSAAQVSLGGKPLDIAALKDPLPLMPGVVTFEVTLADGSKVQKQVTLKAGESSEFVFDVPEPRPAPAPITQVPATAPPSAGAGAIRRKTAGYVLGAVGVVGVGVFVGVGLVGAGSYEDSNARCAAQLCPSSAVDNEGSKSLLRGIGYTGLGIGVLGLGAATWLLLSDGGPSTTTALGIAPGRIQLQHRF